MGVVEDVTTYLAANSTRLTAGVTLFAHILPESSGNSHVSGLLPICGVVEELSPPPIQRFVPSAGGLPAFRRNTMRVMVRSTGAGGGEPDPRPSRGLIDNIWNLVERFPPNSTVTAGSQGPMTFETQGSPSIQTRDNNGRQIWSFTFEATVVPTTST